MSIVRASLALLFVGVAGVWATGLDLPADIKQGMCFFVYNI